MNKNLIEIAKEIHGLSQEIRKVNDKIEDLIGLEYAEGKDPDRLYVVICKEIILHEDKITKLSKKRERLRDILKLYSHLENFNLEHTSIPEVNIMLRWKHDEANYRFSPHRK